jgi:hypothetical protein
MAYFMFFFLLRVLLTFNTRSILHIFYFHMHSGRRFYFPYTYEVSEAYPVLCEMDVGIYFRRKCEANHPYASTGELNAWSYVSTFSYIFIV